MHITYHLTRWVCMLGLMLGLLCADLSAQAKPPTDAALGRLIETLTDRSSDGLVAEELDDGSVTIDLQGRFQQVALGQFLDGDLPMTQCVNSVQEANVFFGRDLLTGAPLPPEVTAEHEALVEEARRHVPHLEVAAVAGGHHFHMETGVTGVAGQIRRFLQG